MERLAKNINFFYYKLKDNYDCRYYFYFEVGSFLVSVAKSRAEVVEALELRHLVFINEGLGANHKSRLDIDRYDSFFDHIIVRQKSTGQLIATYRLCSMEETENFYSNNEFDLSALKSRPGPYLELGRACIHPQFRKAIVLNLLWRGVAEYLKLSGCKTLIGCGSIKTINVDEAVRATLYFKSRHLAESQQCFNPRPAFQFVNFNEAMARVTSLSPAELQAVGESLPSLLQSYLSLGARVSFEPALDLDFCCIDYLIILELDKINPLFAKRFLSNN